MGELNVYKQFSNQKHYTYKYGYNKTHQYFQLLLLYCHFNYHSYFIPYQVLKHIYHKIVLGFQLYTVEKTRTLIGHRNFSCDVTRPDLKQGEPITIPP